MRRRRWQMRDAERLDGDGVWWAGLSLPPANYTCIAYFIFIFRPFH